MKEPIESAQNLRKAKVYRYSGCVPLLLAVFFLMSTQYLLFLIFFGLYYLMFGLTGTAGRFWRKGRFGLSSLCLFLTVPMTLLPYWKAEYYLIASMTASSRGKVALALNTARKVKPEALVLNNRKALLYGQMAALCFDSGEMEEGKAYLKQAKETPHDQTLDKQFERMGQKLREEKKRKEC